MKTFFTIVPLVLAPVISLLQGTPEEAAAPGPAQLLLSSEGMLLEVKGEPSRRFTSVDDLVLAVPGLRGEFAVEDPRAAPERPPEPGARKKGATVRIEEGEIPILDFARFLADATGLPVIHDSSDAALAGRKVTVASTMEEATGEIVKQILEVNRIRVREERAGGRLTLRLESMGEDGGLVEPSPRPIVVSEGGRGAPGRGRAPRILAGLLSGPRRDLILASSPASGWSLRHCRRSWWRSSARTRTGAS